MSTKDAASEVADLFLRDVHEAAGAKFVVFANTNMPIFYPSGIVQEHLHTRKAASLFDVSHMKLLLLEGIDVGQLISRCLPLSASSIPVGKCQYSFLLNDDAGIIDDLILTKLGADRYLLTVNAANWQTDLAELMREAANFANVVVTPLERVILALQGPKAADSLLKLGWAEAAELDFMSAYEPKEDWLITRSGYTGEDGFEIALPYNIAKEIVLGLLASPETRLAGLAARDSLRLEAGLCLHGQDITLRTSPVEAGLLWAIPKLLREQGGFRGAAALQNLLKHRPQLARCGFLVKGRQPVRAGATIVDAAGKIIGEITSGGFGPSVDAAIAMGYLNKEYITAEQIIYAQQRGKNIEIQLHKLPFVPHNYHK